MMSLFEAAWVIARRDFVATVYSRSFILFLIAPLIVAGAAFAVGQAADESALNAARPKVALISDSQTTATLLSVRERVAAGTSDQALPDLRAVSPAENVAIQAGRLLADEEAAYSAVFSGSLDQPVIIGPRRIDDSIARRMQLLVDEAREADALYTAGVALGQVSIRRVVTEQAAGNLQSSRRKIAQVAQTMIFMVTLLLATLLLSNLAEEKSNKVIEVLAAAVPLDAVFLGKLIAMLGISLVGVTLWGGMIGLAYVFFQTLQDWMTLPQVGPAVGWPGFLLLLLIYYAVNYMLLGALFLGIGGQASNIREIQTLSMPVTLLQVFVFMISLTAIGDEAGLLLWTAYVLPFSSPLAMVAHAAQHDSLWPHALALLWQAFWIVLIIRVSARLFRITVMKSASEGAFFSFSGLRRKRAG